MTQLWYVLAVLAVSRMTPIRMIVCEATSSRVRRKDTLKQEQRKSDYSAAKSTIGCLLVMLWLRLLQFAQQELGAWHTSA